jgi:syntaxin 5
MVSIQDRTTEFRTILTQAQKRQSSTKGGAQRQSLLTAQEKQQANGSTQPGKPSSRSEFARNAAQIGRSITSTMGKLERLAQLARKRALFDDRPVEIAELTYIIKQDLASINSQISSLQSINQTQHPNASQPKSADQEGQHNKNVVLMLQNTVTDVAANFKDVLEERTKNIQASRSRQGEFVSSVSARSQGYLDASRSESPLYQNTGTRQRTPNASNIDLLSLEPSGPSALTRGGQQSDQQLLMMEEAQPQNQYIEQRGQAIETIERTINELGGIFGQLASMVSEQGEMLQRIDANTEDVVDNVQGAQRELLKYWSRVQGNRWLVAKMFGVLMVSIFLCVESEAQRANGVVDLLPSLGADSGLSGCDESWTSSCTETSKLAMDSHRWRLCTTWILILGLITHRHLVSQDLDSRKCCENGSTSANS